MAVMLKNLVARAPQTQDLQTLSRLIASCEGVGSEMTISSLEQLLPCWRCPDFHPATDAWVIATNKGQVVAFACVWCDEPEQISTFICVDPVYRNRGIGTLLLRLVEMRARQQGRLAQPNARVVLRGLVNAANAGAQNLFEREGYQAGQQILRVAFRHPQESSELPIPMAQMKLRADGELEQGWLDITPYQDGLCTICLYRVYEKELQSASVPCIAAQNPVVEADKYAIARAS